MEKGTHDQLLTNQSGTYTALIKLAEGAAQKEKEMLPVLDAPEGVESSPKVAAQAVEEETLEVNLDENEEDEPIKKTGKKQKKPKVKNVPFSRAFVFARPDRAWFFPALLGSAGVGISFPMIAYLMSNALSAFYLPNNSQIIAQVEIYALAYFGLAINHFLSTFIQTSSFGVINGRMTARVRRETFRALLKSEIGFFDDKDNSVGQLTSRLATDAALVKATISDRLGLLVQNVATLAVGLSFAFSASWQVSLVVLATFPLIVLSGAAQMRALQGRAASNQSELVEAGRTITEAIGAIRTVKAFNMKEGICRVYDSQLEKSLSRLGGASLIAGVSFGFSQSTRFFTSALVYWYGSKLIVNHTISFQQLIQANFGVLMSAISLGQSMALGGMDLAKGQQALNSIFKALDRPSLINYQDEAGDQPSDVRGDLEFNDVVFAYPTRYVFFLLCFGGGNTNVDMKINPFGTCL